MPNPALKQPEDDQASRGRIADMLESIARVMRHGDMPKVLQVLGQPALNLSALGNANGGGIVQFPNLVPVSAAVSEVAPERPQIEDPHVRALVERNLKRQERMYREYFGVTLKKNPDYQVFRKAIIQAAMQAHKKGMKCFCLVLGDDVLGPGEGISAYAALSAIRARDITIDEVVSELPNRSLGQALESTDVPFEVSYGFWSSGGTEPDKDLKAVPMEKIRKRKVYTQGCLEHMLFILTQYMCTGNLANTTTSTLCELPATATILDARGQNVASHYCALFGVMDGTLKLRLPYVVTGDELFSHRHMIKVELSKKA